MRDFAGIYEQHAAQVYGFFACLIGSRADAEDLTQQTFERALRGWGRYDESRGTTSTWLLAIARNLFVDHWRAARAVGSEAAQEVDLEVIAAPPDRPSLGLEPDLERALALLSPRDRELIGLRFGADLSGSEIAAMTGLNLANVQKILSRSLRRMRAALEAGGPGTEPRAAVL